MKISDGGGSSTNKKTTTYVPPKTVPKTAPDKTKDDKRPASGGYNPLNTITNAVSQAYHVVTNSFSQLGNMLAQTPEVKSINQQLASIPVGGQQSPIYYQIKSNDKSLDDIALRHGVSLNQVVNLNNTKTLPPKGSYIQIMPSMSSLINQGIPASTAAQIVNSQNKNNNGGYQDYAQRHPEISQAAQIKNQIASGQLPTTIPLAALPYITNASGQSLTIQQAQQAGYVLKNGQLVHSGSPAATGAPTASSNPTPHRVQDFASYSDFVQANKDFLNSKRYDPTTKKYVSVGKLIKQGKLDLKNGRFYPRGNAPHRPKGKGGGHHRGGGHSNPAPVTTVPVETTTEGPQTILDLHLGSG